MWPGKGKTAIVGIGYSELTRHARKPLGVLAVEACHAAIEDAGLRPAQIDGLSTYPDSPFAGAGNRDGEDLVSVSWILDHLALAADIRWYAQIDSGMIASTLIEASHALLAGACDYVLVWRALHPPRRASRGGARAVGPAQFTLPYGSTSIIQSHAYAWQRYMHRYGATREALAALALNSRRNANLNPHAFFHSVPLSHDEYMTARWIAEPLCLYDCDVPLDGCIALVLTSAERARDLRQPPAYIAGYGQNTAPQHEAIYYTLCDYMAAGRSLAGKLWSSAGLGARDMDAAQLYDGFNPSTIYWLEAAGFCQEGEGASFVQEGRIALDGELPLNTFGGSLSEGRLHGMGHIAEAVRQVTDRAEGRQIPGAAAVCAIDGSPMLRGSGLIATRDR